MYMKICGVNMKIYILVWFDSVRLVMPKLQTEPNRTIWQIFESLLFETKPN